MTRYRVLVADLFYPTDAAIVARLVAGENLSLEDRRMVHRRAGAIVSDIPAVSLEGLVAEGAIALVDEPAAPAKAGKD